MSGLRELYQEVILDHNRRPRNFRVIEDATRTIEGRNPLCGDHLTLFLRVKGNVIEDAAFQGSGCAISKASASLMTDSIKGKTIPEVEALFDAVHRMVTAGGPGAGGAAADTECLGKLTVLSGVSEFPVRIKCASLAWHALNTALKEHAATVTTETGEILG
jgi:nitrogen fixation NifU-like protein